MFHDPDVYVILFQWTSLSKSKRNLKSKKDVQLISLSQARLFDFIARVAPFDWGTLTTSSLPQVEKQFMTPSDNADPIGGILQYAATRMIDKDDLLMKALRQDFFQKLLGTIQDEDRQDISPRLLEAIQQGAGAAITETRDNGLHL